MKPTIELKVGAFVFVGLILMAVSILMLGGDKALFKKHYHLFVEYGQVQGLATGSVVSLTGLPVGNVSKIIFIPEHNKLRVDLKLDQAYQDRIHEGTTAEIRTQGALGDKFIYLTPGPQDRPALDNNAELIAVEGGDFMSVISSKGDSLKHVFEIITELRNLMKAINGDGRSQKIMDNLTASSQSLKMMVQELHGEGDQKSELRKSVVHLSSILRKIDQGEGTLGALINDPTLHENLKALLGGSPRQRYLKGLARDAIQSNEEKKK